MKKVLFLLLVFLIKLNAYEYLFYDNSKSTSPNYAKYMFFIDNSGKLQLKRENVNEQIIIYNPNYEFYTRLNGIKNNLAYYIDKNTFDNYLKNDVYFLNDFYLQATNYIFNYFYNENQFNADNYILYSDYELLYNSDGLAVESIVDGVWAGLYSESDKNISGDLYNEKGELVYVNGLEPSWMQKQFSKFGFDRIVENSLSIYGYVMFGVILLFLIVILIERFTDFSLLAIIGRLGR